MSLDTHQSVYREKLIEHLFVGEMLKLSWLKYGATLEISYSMLDRSGHDIVLEANDVVRHIQLKTSGISAVTASQNAHLDLGRKPSGCVIWIQFAPDSMVPGPFLFLGGLPGEPLADLQAFKVARHTKANAQGAKAERPNIRVVPRARFALIESIEALYAELFGSQPG